MSAIIYLENISKLAICNLYILQGAIPKDIDLKDNQNIELTSSLISVLSADIVLYPLETILHRFVLLAVFLLLYF